MYPVSVITNTISVFVSVISTVNAVMTPLWSSVGGGLQLTCTDAGLMIVTFTAVGALAGAVDYNYTYNYIIIIYRHLFVNSMISIAYIIFYIYIYSNLTHRLQGFVQCKAESMVLH